MSARDPKLRTSARPKVVDGVTFHCYRTGILQTAWISEDGRCYAARNRGGRGSGGETWHAAVDGIGIEGANPRKSKRFRSQDAALLAAVIRSKG